MVKETASIVFKNLVNSPVGIVSEFITNKLAIKYGYQPLRNYFAEIQTGKTPPMSNPEYYSSNDIQWIKPSDIGFEKYITSSDFISDRAVQENKATIYKPNTILIICIGGGIGRLGIVDTICSSNQQITGILFRKEIMAEYAYYFFLPRYKIFEKNSSKSTLPIINQKGLGSLDFTCPDISTQEEIVRYLDYCNQCLDKCAFPTNLNFKLSSEILRFSKKVFKAYYAQNTLLSEFNRQLTLIEKLNQSILQEAVQGKLVPQNPTDEPASELLKRIKEGKRKNATSLAKQKNEKELPPIQPDEIPFEIPDSWVWCRLGEIIEYTENLDIQKHLPPDTLINYVDIDSIDNQNQVIRSPKVKKVSELSTRARRVLKKGYIAYSTVRPYLKNIAVIEKEKENYIGSTGFNVFKAVGSELKYSFYFLLTPYVNDLFQKMMVGFNSPSITNSQFENCLIPLPPASEQERIVAEVEKQLAKTKRLKEHILADQEATEHLLKALLHEAFEVEKE